MFCLCCLIVLLQLNSFIYGYSQFSYDIARAYNRTTMAMKTQSLIFDENIQIPTFAIHFNWLALLQKKKYCRLVSRRDLLHLIHATFIPYIHYLLFI